MAKGKKLNSLVQLFTSKDVYTVKSMIFFMEATFYNYYVNNPKKGFSIQGVRSDFVQVEELEDDGFCEMYGEYVIEAKKLKGSWGVQLEFITEEIFTPLGGDDEL